MSGPLRAASIAATLGLVLAPLAAAREEAAPASLACATPIAAPLAGAEVPAWRLPWRVRCSGVGDEPVGAAAVLLGRPLRVNQASARELRALPGISRGLAQAIVDERAAGGAFASARELQRVPGIGPQRARRLADKLDFAVPRH